MISLVAISPYVFVVCHHMSLRWFLSLLVFTLMKHTFEMIRWCVLFLYLSVGYVMLCIVIIDLYFVTVTSVQEAKLWRLVWTVLPVYRFPSPTSRTCALLSFGFGPGLYVISPADWNLISRNMYSNFHPVAANIRQVQLSQSHVSGGFEVGATRFAWIKYPSDSFTFQENT